MSLNLNVVRNDKTLTLSEGKYGKKSLQFAGQTFYYPVIQAPLLKTLDDGTEVLTNVDGLIWWGLQDLTNALNKLGRTIFADIRSDNVDETTGLLNEEKMMQEWAAFTAGAEKLKDIIAQIEIYVDEQQTILASDQFGATVGGTVDGAKTEEALKLEERMLELAALIRPLKAAKAALEAEYADRVAKRAARKAKEEAAAPAGESK